MANENFDETQPFTRAQMRAAEVETTALRRRSYVHVLKGVWIRRDAVTDLTVLQAALLIHPKGAFASHLSAAQVLGLPVPDHPFAHVMVDKHADRRFRPQIKPHVSGRERQVIVVQGIRTTDPVTTFIDCAGWLSFIDLVILGDALVKKFKVSPRALLAACRESGHYYAGRAAFAAEFVRQGVDSPMETRLRLLIVLAGLPEPQVNVIVRHQDGSWKRRYDLCYVEIKLVVEYDGRQHAEDAVQWGKDIERREELDDDGYRILVVTANGIFVNPEETLRRIRRQLVLRGVGQVPAIDESWRQHFAA